MVERNASVSVCGKRVELNRLSDHVHTGECLDVVPFSLSLASFWSSELVVAAVAVIARFLALILAA